MLTGILLGVAATSSARDAGNINVREHTASTAAGGPAYCIAGHDIGKLFLSVNNNGTFGDGFSFSGTRDCFTDERVFSCEYPKGSRTTYLFAGAFWIGAIVGRDTLVSTGADGWLTTNEFHPDPPPLGDMIFRSIVDPAKPEFKGAVSEQDYIAVYTDTCSTCQGVVPDPRDGRAHIPLNIEVTQRSYAWSYSYADDFVLFDYSIKNIGQRRLRKVYMGVYVDADVHDRGDQFSGFDDDLCGFFSTQPAIEGFTTGFNCPHIDTVNIAYIIDNDGDFDAKPPFDTPVPNVTATKIVRTPSDSLKVSFNWWISNGDPKLDYGPQTHEHFRDLGTGGQGTPHGDR
ncbi:MAG: hypothetical protein D6800_13070, partial [Candidatus Zixiibacteriota bacterium]